MNEHILNTSARTCIVRPNLSDICHMADLLRERSAAGADRDGVAFTNAGPEGNGPGVSGNVQPL